ncbi:MAG: hypothetical protein SCM11_12700 [Bacillota bacterium]|nr:hypothetical protein [Bacillota bacterium]
MKFRPIFVCKTGALLVVLFLVLLLPLVGASASNTEPILKFVREDTVCTEILELGLIKDAATYNGNLHISYDWGKKSILPLSHGIGLRIEVYPETDGAKQYFESISVFKPSSSTSEVLANVRSVREISWIEKTTKITGTSRYILYKDNILITIKGTSLNEGSFDVGLAADILERHALAVLSDKFQEYAFSGVVKGSNGESLGNIQLILQVANQTYKTSTDAYGYYSIKYDGSVKKGFDCKLYVPLQYRRNDKTYYRIIFVKQPVWVAKSFKLSSAKDLLQNIDFRAAANNESGYDGKPDLEFLPHFCAMYYHMGEAVDFYLDYMKFNIDYKLPVDVIAGYSVTTHYTPSVSSIYINIKDMKVESPDRPMNREWHEFSHHAMFSMYGRWPDGAPGSVNHAGYINPSTSDSFSEGFAEFMAMMIADYYQYPNPHVYAKIGSLELNYKAWEYRGHAEEVAIAGVLWDLYDGKNDDNVQLTANDLWYILKDYRENFTDVYGFVMAKYPNQRAGIDEIFIAHGFFADKTAGNGKWDRYEPFNDTNNNKKYDVGEYFVDYSVLKIEYTKGETIGPASNYQRPLRRSAVELPDHFVKVDNQVPYYLVEVKFPGQPDLNYEIRTQNQDGLIYVQLPPPDYSAIISVKPEDVNAGKILTFNTLDFDSDDLDIIDHGYYLEHDFQISGVIPTGLPLPPVSVGDLEISTFDWDERMEIVARPEDYQYSDVDLDFLFVESPSATTLKGISATIWIGMGLLIVLAVMTLLITWILKAKY